MSANLPARGRVLALVAELLHDARPASWADAGVSDDEFFATSRSQEFTSLVHERLAARPGVGWPERVRRRIADIARAETARELIRCQETTKLLAALDEAGVSPILVKGAALAYTIYPTPSSRWRADVDLMIRRSDADAVRGVLAAHGYAAQNACDADVIFNQFQMSRVDAFGILHAFDVHWKISTQQLFADALTFDEIDRQAVVVAPLGAGARAASPLHALLLASVHRVMHHRDSDWLIWIYDIHLLASSLPSGARDDFKRLAATKGVAAIAAHELALSRTMFGTGGWDAVIERLGAIEGEPSAIYLSPNRRWRHDLASNMRGLSRWSERVRLLREVMLPSGRYILDAYGVADRPWGRAMLPALYAHRLIQGGWRVATGRK